MTKIDDLKTDCGRLIGGQLSDEICCLGISKPRIIKDSDGCISAVFDNDLSEDEIKKVLNAAKNHVPFKLKKQEEIYKIIDNLDQSVFRKILIELFMGWATVNYKKFKEITGIDITENA